MTKIEIETEIRGKGDFVKIDYLTRFIKGDAPIDKKKFAHVKLSEIYSERKMFEEAAKSLDNAALASTIFSEKVKIYGQESLMYARAGSFDQMDRAKKKAFANLSGEDSAFKAQLVFELAKTIRGQAEGFLEMGKRNNARLFFEKLLQMQGVSEQERRDVGKKLLEIYEILGKFQDAKVLKGQLGL